MVRQAFLEAHAPPAPLLAAVARKTAVVLLSYVRAQRKARRAAAAKLPEREFGTVILHGQRFGAVYEDGKLIAVIPDVERM